MPLVIRARSIGHDEPNGIQKLHLVPTSRLGGVAIVVAYWATLAFAIAGGRAPLSSAVLLAFCALPVVVVGLWEDVTRRIHAWHRLAASVISGALASLLAGGIVGRLDLPFVDDWLKQLVVVLPLTWFMVAGACNAINLIDGAHGLAGGTAVILFGGLAAMAGYFGDTIVLTQSLAMVGAIAGFLAWNYPRGKVFLGDAGAYFLGFMYAELSIRIVGNNPGLSAWFVIALAAYPIVETLYSIYRRKLVHRTASMGADAAHLHSLMFRRLLSRHGTAPQPDELVRANARVAPRLWVHGLACLAVALLLHDRTMALIVFTLCYCAFYVLTYRWLSRDRDEPLQAPTLLPATRTVEGPGE